jgi:hypothetical protein
MKTRADKRRCAYCGQVDPETVDHVVPRALYPASKKASPVQRVTVPACAECNNGWSGDEAHFRNVLLLAGEPTPAVSELWTGKTRRSFGHVDGRRRLNDLVGQLVPVETPEGARHMIYPGRDPRVVRIVRKVIRGLCHHHGLLSPVSDRQVWADVQQFLVPPEFETAMTTGHAEEDILQYRYCVLDEDELHSCWVLCFFGRTPFFGIVYRSEHARDHLKASYAQVT